MPARTQVDIAFNRPQSRAYRAIANRHTVMLAFGRGTGKSYFLRLCCWLLVAEYDGRLRDAKDPFHGCRIVWLMPTRKQFVDVHGAAILDELAPSGKFGFLGGHVNLSSWSIRFPGGSILTPFPAEQALAKSARGMRADYIVVDECDDIDMDVYDSVAVPWLSARWSLGRELLGGTPTRGRHGLWYRMLRAGRIGESIRTGKEIPADIKDEDKEAYKSIYSFHATYRDTPDEVDPAAVAKAKAQSLPATFQREWEADPDAGEGLVYPFDEEFNVREPPPFGAFSEFHVGMDHGWVDPGVLLLLGVQGHGEDATVWALDEHFGSEIPNHKWDELAQEWKFATFWPDPSRPDRIDTLRNLGLSIGHAETPVNALYAGIARVADMVFRRKRNDGGPDYAKFYCSRKCTNLIREMGLYRRKKNTDGTFAELPEDKNNHCLVAGTLITTERGEAPIESVTSADRVLTRNGWQQVRWAGQSGETRHTVKVTVENRILEGTPSHKIWTENRGWVPLDELRYVDTLLACPSMGPASHLSTMVNDSADIQSQKTESCESTSRHNAEGHCIGQSGKTQTVQSQMDGTFITRITTRSTTISLISNPNRLSTITLNTGPKSEQNSPEETSNESVRSPRPGIEVQPDAHGIQSMGATRGLSELPSKGTAFSVGVHSKTSRVATQTGFAATTASQCGDARVESTTKTGSVPSAERHSGSIGIVEPRPVRACAVEYITAEQFVPVFDIEVETIHEFFANGVLVQNSTDALRYALFGRFGRPPNYRTTLTG